MSPAHCTVPAPQLDRLDVVRHKIGGIDLFLLSVWSGLAAGLLEAGIRVVYGTIVPNPRLYMVSRHFLWLGPLANLLLFLIIGLTLVLAGKLSPHALGWLSTRLLCACAAMPVLMAAVPQIQAEAWAIFAFGMAVQFVPILERHVDNLRRWLLWSLPFMVATVILLATYVIGGDRVKLTRESGRHLPPANTPNVLLIVLDTVRADHLSLYGYERSTTPVLERLAQDGIRFNEARATAPWTLPSHASMFTGRFPHEVGDDWRSPMRGNFATLAEYLGNHGYATAGFVGNVGYCSQETGLGRGFTHYEDYVMEDLAPLRTSALVEYVAGAVSGILRTFDINSLSPLKRLVTRWFEVKRKNAALIRRAFLRWVAERPETSRPFFAFLNFFDAHQQYILPPGARRRFVNYSLTTGENKIVYELWPYLDKTRLPRAYVEVARDSYDDCVSYIDEQLGLLFDALQRHGVLDRTLVVVTSDHGEGLGDHGLFDHGLSLYPTEIRVPLVIRPPSGLNPSSVVDKSVSLRDLPATIVDLAGLGTGSPFPGNSLARLWRNPPSGNIDLSRESDLVVSELKEPNSATGGDRQRSPALNGPLVSLAADNFVYVRNEGDGKEQLFDKLRDPQELSDRSHDEVMRPVLEGFRQRLERFRGNRLLPAR